VAAWSVETARSVADGVVLVVPAGRARGGRVEDEELGEDLGADKTVVGGATRAESVRAGLEVVPDAADVVVVHDAVRPLASVSLFRAVVDAVRGGAAGAIPVVPVADTLKKVSGDVVQSTIDREDLVTVQTPQAFAASALRAAHRGRGEATDDAGLLEEGGVAVRTVPGDARNVKITRPEDLELAELYLPAVHG
jgi:2-C-methyl-D-erythritol 4-phosphate cytidylyltransferase